MTSSPSSSGCSFEFIQHADSPSAEDSARSREPLADVLLTPVASAASFGVESTSSPAASSPSASLAPTTLIPLSPPADGIVAESAMAAVVEELACESPAVSSSLKSSAEEDCVFVADADDGVQSQLLPPSPEPELPDETDDVLKVS